MKILHVINSMGSGGAEKLLSDYLIHSKDDENKNILLLLSNKKNRFLNILEKHSINTIVSEKSSLYNPLHLISLYRTVKMQSPDIIHVHLFPAIYYVALISIFFPQVKFVMTEHSTTNRRRSIAILRPIERFIYSRFHKIIAVSDTAKESLSNWIIDDKNIDVIINGIDLDKFINSKEIDLRSELNLGIDTKLLVMVARFSPAKDHETLLKALSMLPEEYHLLLVGEGPTKKTVYQLSKKLNIDHRIKFMGFRDNVAETIKSSDIAILSTHYEGLPISAIEAIATGTPLIYSSVPGLKGQFKSIADEIAPRDPEALADQILSNHRFERKINQVK